MKRKRLILTTVLLACVAAVVVPITPRVWRKIAYVEASVQASLPYRGMFYLKKRFAWMPGAVGILPDQTCASCLKGVHVRSANDCPIDLFMGPSDGLIHSFGTANGGGWLGSFDPGLLVGGYVPQRGMWRCTCPDPSHEWNQ